MLNLEEEIRCEKIRLYLVALACTLVMIIKHLLVSLKILTTQ